MFELGHLYVTQGAQQLPEAVIVGFIRRHAAGDFGELDAEDVAVNRSALVYGTRVLSVYRHESLKIFVITEGTRSMTTVLLADEY